MRMQKKSRGFRVKQALVGKGFVLLALIALPVLIAGIPELILCWARRWSSMQ